MDKEQLEKIAEERFKMPEPLTPNMAIEASMVHVQRKAFISGYYYHKQESEGLREEWISVEDRLPDDFDKYGATQKYLVYVENPYFKGSHIWVSHYEKSTFGDKFNRWVGIEPNVHHTNETEPKVIAWAPLPSPPHLNKAND